MTQVEEERAPAARPAAGAEAHAELRAWYLGSLRPKLLRASGSGIVTSAAAAELDRQLRDVLGLPAPGLDEAA
jgi:hypothetical protein